MGIRKTERMMEDESDEDENGLIRTERGTSERKTD